MPKTPRTAAHSLLKLTRNLNKIPRQLELGQSPRPLALKVVALGFEVVVLGLEIVGPALTVFLALGPELAKG